MEKLLDGSKVTPSLENRFSISVAGLSNSLVFHGESAGLPRIRRLYFFAKGNCCPRGKTSLERRCSISKWWFSGQKVWYYMEKVLDGAKGRTSLKGKCWMALGAKLLQRRGSSISKYWFSGQSVWMCLVFRGEIAGWI
jgi:hypothetical protein